MFVKEVLGHLELFQGLASADISLLRFEICINKIILRFSCGNLSWSSLI